MWFTVTGRIYTRLASLVGPLLLATCLTVLHEDRDFWLLFGLMAGVGLVLDFSLYGWVIGYQPRWLTIVLGGLEFLLLKWIVEWPYPFEIRLHTKQALLFYSASWLLIWATTQGVLPIFWPRWAEDGGEFRRRLSGSGSTVPVLGDFFVRRRLYGNSLVIWIAMFLPWLILWFKTSPPMRFIGLVGSSPTHLQALGQVVRSTYQPVDFVSTLIAQIAVLGHWPFLRTYYIIWIAVCFFWILGAQGFFADAKRFRFYLVGIMVLPALFLSGISLLKATIVLWFALIGFRRQFLPSQNILKLGTFLSLLAVTIWATLWIRPHPLAFLREDAWQTLTWLQQSLPSDAVIQAPSDLMPFIPAFTGHQTTTDQFDNFAVYQVKRGEQCSSSSPVFVHGQLCVFAP